MKVFHNEDENPATANIKQALGSGGLIHQTTPAPEQSTDGYDVQVAHAQTIRDGGNVMTRSLIRSDDFVDVTTVHVSRIFDRFRRMCLNTRRSDCVNTAGNPHRLVSHENETTCVGNTVPVNNNVSTPDVSRVECLHSISTVTPIDCCVSTAGVDSPLVTPTPEQASGPVATQTYDSLGHMPSSSMVAPLNHAYLCMDITGCTIRPGIVTFPDSSLKNAEKMLRTNVQSLALEQRAIHVLGWSRILKSLLPTQVSQHDRAIMLKGSNYGERPEYHLCCGGGKIYMPETPAPPLFIQQLLRNNHFMEHIRAYNQMFAMTSFGAKVDDSVNMGRGPYVFKVSGQIYHWIGSLCPEEGYEPRFLQLYIYDTQDEVSNRMQNFRGRHEQTLNPEIFEGQIHVLDEHNGLVRLFRTAQDRCSAWEIPGLKIRLYNKGGVRAYELPTSGLLGGIVFEDGPKSRTDLDVIIEFRGGLPQRINKVHQSYMSLQYPLLFIFGSKITDARQIDNYISAEIPDPVEDPTGYKVVTELMMHGPCGVANPDAVCTENRTRNKNFPKKYNDITFFDTNGHTHYRRRQTEIHVMKSESRLDNYNVVPYNRRLSMAFHAHINVEYCGWSMLIKYLFKYISKGPDRILVKVSKPIRDTSTLVHK
ncbi:hypothetical protein Tco_0640395 [Tanacetum coccineum]